MRMFFFFNFFSADFSVIFFFFFQAEDGIRDLTVTGVQTCALPISWRNSGVQRSGQSLVGASRPLVGGDEHLLVASLESTIPFLAHPDVAFHLLEIGRASCRERV